jgi:hypothetical protein
MRKRYRMQREIRTYRLKKPIPFCPCPGLNTRSLFWGCQGFNNAGQLPPCTQRFDQTLIVVRFLPEMVIDVKNREGKAVFLRQCD